MAESQLRAQDPALLIADLQLRVDELKAALAAAQQHTPAQDDAEVDALEKENDQLTTDIQGLKTELQQLNDHQGRRAFTYHDAPVAGEDISQVKNHPIKVMPTTASPYAASVAAPKAQTKQQPAANAAPKSDDGPVDVSRCKFVVGRIVSCERHPDADALYVEQIDVGEEKPRTIISGLVKHIPLEEMQNRLVIVIANLKPAKMRGIMSEGMVMCASTPDKVEIIDPPAGAVPGDRVVCPGFEDGTADEPFLNPKKKIFEAVQPDFLTNEERVATYKGAPWTVSGKGVCTAGSMTKAPIK